jgi:hypothetical protein
MAIVVALLGRELLPLRREVRQLRNQVGILTIDDGSQIHAIDVPTDAENVWKWRIYVPRGQTAAMRFKTSDISATGYPQSQDRWPLIDGEQVVSLTIKPLKPGGPYWISQVRTPRVVATISINPKNFYAAAPSQSRNETTGSATAKIDSSGKLMLIRSRIADANQSNSLDKNDPLPGFMAWVEREQ